MARPYKPLAIGNEFIVLSMVDGVDHMKLQKLTYFAHGWWLAYNDEPIVSELPQVWKHGPVFKSMYHALSNHGWRPIKTLQNDNFTSPPPRVDVDDEAVHAMIKWVWARYCGYRSEYLSEITHKRGTPWEVTAREHEYRVPRNTEIPTPVVKEHFRQLAEEYGFTEQARAS